MENLNLSDVVKLKLELYLREYEYDISTVSNEQSNFIRNCNSKLSGIKLTLDAFKSTDKKYKFSEKTAHKLIQLEALNIKQSIKKIDKESYDLLDLDIMDKYYKNLEEIVESHFNGDDKDRYLQEIVSLQKDVKLHKHKRQIVLELFDVKREINKENEQLQLKQQYWEALNQDLSKIVVDIYSKRKFPNLLEGDRDALLHELYSELTSIMVQHSSMISLVNDIRVSEDEEVRLQPIEDIMCEF